MIYYDDSGVKLIRNVDIPTEVLHFYKKLLGTAATSHTGVDIPIIRNGRQVISGARNLIAPVTTEEIDSALKSIDDNKAP